MNGDIQRRNAQFAYTVEFRIIDVCQRHVISVYQRKAEIVILEIKGITHRRRHLVYEAENALVFASVLFIHQKIRETQSEIAFAFFFKSQFCPVASHDDRRLFILG